MVNKVMGLCFLFALSWLFVNSLGETFDVKISKLNLILFIHILYDDI